MSDFDPYHNWLGIPETERPISKYRLLAIADFEDNADVINAAVDRQTIYLRTLQAGEHAALVAEMLNEVSQARVTLLNADQKAAYDEQLREQQTPEPKPASAPTPMLQTPPPLPNITFTCPHCSHTTELASSTEGMKGNCPSCKAEVVITAGNPESEWLVMSRGLKSETPTKLKDSEIIALIRDKTIAGGAQLSNISKPNVGWISLKDSHFYQYAEELKTEKKRQREKEKEAKKEAKEKAKEKNERIHQLDEELQNQRHMMAQSKLREDRKKVREQEEKSIELSSSEVGLLKKILATNVQSTKYLKEIFHILAFFLIITILGIINYIIVIGNS